MNVKAEDIMITDVVTIEADDSVALARLKMSRMGIGGLPVIEGKKIVGMITHRDTILVGDKASGLKVRDIMTPKVRTISRKTSLKEIAAIMKETGYQRLPVVENKKLVGIVTQSCIIKALAEKGFTQSMIITLTTDFGSSEYVGTMKGVIYSICPEAKIVDITHSIKKFDIRHAAYVLRSSAPYFPKGSIHCIVVDPGVGTERRGVIIKTKKHIYVGPDNGVFSLIEGIEKIVEIASKAKSKTFHGRDVFAPVAARLACGAKIEEFGREIKSIKRIIGEIKIEKNAVSGEVVCIDSFGNVITNINEKLLRRAGIKYNSFINLRIKGKKHRMKFVESYGFASRNELVCLIGSSSYLEVAVNQGNAAEKLKAIGGDKVKISKIIY